MRNRMNFPLGYQYLTALILTAVTGAHAAICCEMPDAGDVAPQDTGKATAQEAWVDLAIDSVWSTSDPNGVRDVHCALHVLAKRQADTSVFFNYVPELGWPDGWITAYDHNVADFPDSFTASDPLFAYSPGDTLRNVLAMRIVSNDGRTRLALGGVQCKFISPAPGPFPISEALRTLDRFRDSLAAAAGQSGPPSRVKLGPIFIGLPGDPGLLVRAEAQENAWLVRYQTGSGDCPAGCTHHEETVYRVEPQGKAEIVSQRELFVLCRPPDAISAHIPFGKRLIRSAGCYTPDGRKLGARGRPEARVPWLSVPDSP
jgi:hypothetical protein